MDATAVYHARASLACCYILIHWKHWASNRSPMLAAPLGAPLFRLTIHLVLLPPREALSATPLRLLSKGRELRLHLSAPETPAEPPATPSPT